jgi:hypothetical protein
LGGETARTDWMIRAGMYSQFENLLLEKGIETIGGRICRTYLALKVWMNYEIYWN